MLKYEFRVKQYFDNREPIILRFKSEPGITENEFFLKILDRMTIDSLLGIYKLEICQYVESLDHLLPFIQDCQGEININRQDYFSRMFDEKRRDLIANYE